MKAGDRIDLVLTPGADDKATARIEDDDGAVPFRRVREGQPIAQDSVLLKALPPCPAHPGTIHAEVVYCPEARDEDGREGRSGPARVSNTKYRSGWDQVFGDKPPSDALN
jgi:hypothetical protein